METNCIKTSLDSITAIRHAFNALTDAENFALTELDAVETKLAKALLGRLLIRQGIEIGDQATERFFQNGLRHADYNRLTPREQLARVIDEFEEMGQELPKTSRIRTVLADTESPTSALLGAVASMKALIQTLTQPGKVVICQTLQ